LVLCLPKFRKTVYNTFILDVKSKLSTHVVVAYYWV